VCWRARPAIERAVERPKLCECANEGRKDEGANKRKRRFQLISVLRMINVISRLDGATATVMDVRSSKRSPDDGQNRTIHSRDETERDALWQLDAGGCGDCLSRGKKRVKQLTEDEIIYVNKRSGTEFKVVIIIIKTKFTILYLR